MKQFAVYIRVSTQRQGQSHLGLEAQLESCQSYISKQNGVISKVFQDIESGKSRTRQGLWDAIDYCKSTGETLVIAKLDRLARDIEFTFRVMNTGIDIVFADMPIVNTIILGVFASVAQYERELTSKRTKDALKAKKERGELTGGCNELWGKNTGANRKEAIGNMVDASSRVRRERAVNNPANRDFRDFISDWEAIHGKIGCGTDWQAISDKLNERGKKTSTGLEFNPNRAKAMYYKILGLYASL